MSKIAVFQEEQNIHVDGKIGPETFRQFMSTFKLTSIQCAHFLGQLHHETGGFTKDTESLNYSVLGLRSTFAYYKNRPKEASEDGRTWHKKADQETIANKVYWDKNRTIPHQLGNIAWGDGWKYRGRGAIQLTGLWNYTEFGEWVEDFLVVDQPNLVVSEYYWHSALWYFEKRNIWKRVTGVSIKEIEIVTKLINGGLNGLEERINLTRMYNKIS
jgi:putative chitinase